MRIRKITIQDKASARQFALRLSEKPIDSSNFFSVLIGANGTQKSQSLREILETGFSAISRASAYGVQSTLDKGGLVFWRVGQDSSNYLPTKIIAVSGVATDRFPTRLSPRKTRREFAEDLYRYVGPKTENNLVSRVQNIQQLAMSLCSYAHRVKDRTEQLSIPFDALSLAQRIVFPLRTRPAAKDDKWTTKEVVDWVISKKLWHQDSELSKKLIEECVTLANYPGNPRLILDLGRSVPIRCTTRVSFEAIKLALETDLLTIYQPFVFGKGERQLPLSELSSGQWHVLSSLLFTAIAVDDGSLVLIDEPENSLHPAWQREYPVLFHNALSCVKGVHVVVATHSPLIASSLPPIQAEVIKLARNRNGNIAANRVESGPFGWTADDILLQVFGLESTRSAAFEKEMELSLRLFGNGNRSSSALKASVLRLTEFAKYLPKDDIARNVISTMASVVVKQTASEE